MIKFIKNLLLNLSIFIANFIFFHRISQMAIYHILFQIIFNFFTFFSHFSQITLEIFTQKFHLRFSLNISQKIMKQDTTFKKVMMGLISHICFWRPKCDPDLTGSFQTGSGNRILSKLCIPTSFYCFIQFFPFISLISNSIQ